MNRRRNLLEAFQSADRPAAPQAPASASAGGLFSGRGRAAGGSFPVPRWLFPLLGLTLAFFLGFTLGRRTGPGATGQARAQEPEQRPVAPAARPLVQPRAFQEKPALDGAAALEAAPTSPERIEDSALYDPRNLYTVAVAAYSKTNKDHLDFAWATHQFLKDARLPVFPPVASGNFVQIFVGAAPTASELDKVEDAVKALVRDGKKPYADAIVVRIDKLIPNRTPKGN